MMLTMDRTIFRGGTGLHHSSGGLGLLWVWRACSPDGSSARCHASRRRRCAKFPNFPAKAKHNIVLFMVGGPSQLDMFDPKPALLKYQGQRPSIGRSSHRTHHGRPAAIAVRVQAVRARRRSREQSAAESRFDDRRHLRDQVDVHVQPDAHAGAQPVSYGQHRGDAAFDGRVDFLWARAARTRDLPGFVVLGPGQNSGGGLARAGFLPRNIRARASTIR